MRREFSRKIMAAAFARAAGGCEGCGSKLWSGRFQFDHIIADSIGGEPTLENCAVLCLACHGAKSAKIDTPRAAKTKRQHYGHIGAKRSSSRPLPGGRNSGWKIKIGGGVESRDRGGR